MTPKQYLELLDYISKNNGWGRDMYQNIVKRKRKVIKYIASIFDSRDGIIYAVRFSLGGKEWTLFRIENEQDLKTVYEWLDETRGE